MKMETKKTILLRAVNRYRSLPLMIMFPALCGLSTALPLELAVTTVELAGGYEELSCQYPPGGVRAAWYVAVVIKAATKSIMSRADSFRKPKTIEYFSKTLGSLLKICDKEGLRVGGRDASASS